MSKIKVVSVKFLNGFSSTLYDFKCADELNVDKGDIVVMDTINGIQLGEIRAIKGYLSESGCAVIGLGAAANATLNKATKWVIDKVDMTAHTERLEREAKLKELKKKMDVRIKQLQSEQVYRMFAENDDTLRELLSEYDGMNRLAYEESR